MEEKRGREGRDLAKQSVHLQRQSKDEPRAHLKERSVTQHSHEPPNSQGVDTLGQKQTHNPGPCKDQLSMFLSDLLSSTSTTAVFNFSVLLILRLDFSDVTLMMHHLTVP